jgi:hypothetical protein
VKRNILFLFIVFIIVSSLIITGCTNGNNRRPTILNVYTGTQGVTVKLTDNNPPAELYEGSEVILMAEIWNKGAFTPRSGVNGPIYISVNVDDVYLEVSGGIGESNNYNVLNNLINTNTEANNLVSLYLSGKSQSWPTGERTIIPIANLKVNKITGTRESPTTKIETSACYEYKTVFSESICVDTDIYNLDKNPICRNQRTYTYAGQGAPLIVSKLEVDMIPVGVTADAVGINISVVDESGQIQGVEPGSTEGKSIIIEPSFRIYFKNTDTGVVLGTDGNSNPCVYGPSTRGEVIRIKANLSNIELECTKPDINMYSNEGSVRCWLPAERLPSQFGLNRNYELPLLVEAEYFYRTTTTNDVKIKRLI